MRLLFARHNVRIFRFVRRLVEELLHTNGG
jgi:hypothetical protein